MNANITLAITGVIALLSIARSRDGSRAMPRELSDRVDDLEFDVQAILGGAPRPSEAARKRDEAMLLIRREMTPMIQEIRREKASGVDTTLLQRTMLDRARRATGKKDPT
jgi:hypothetical protein